jgi:hypothetical protein
LMQFAIKAGIRTDDPTLGVKHAKIKTDGFRTWGEEDIAAFEGAAGPLRPPPSVTTLQIVPVGLLRRPDWRTMPAKRSSASARGRRCDGA